METIEQNQKPVKLTKSGKPDGRSISSKKNLEKGKMKVREILHKAKQSKIPDEEETDDEEFEIISAHRSIPANIVEKEPMVPSTSLLEGRVVGVADPYKEQPQLAVSNVPFVDEIEMTKKELQELKKQIQENNLREERRKQLEVQRQVDKIRMEAYGRLNSLSQNMSMKF